MKKYILLFVFMFSLPIFSQNVEATSSENLSLWDFLSEEQKGIIVQAFLESKLQLANPAPVVIYDEEKYQRARKMQIAGRISFFGGLGILVSAEAFSSITYSSNPYYYDAMYITGMVAIATGIPLMAVGKSQRRRNKPPTIALTPNGLNFSMRF